MAATRSLNVLIATDTKDLQKGRKEAEKEFEKIEKAGAKASTSLRGSIGSAGARVGSSMRLGLSGLAGIAGVAGVAAGAALSKGIVDALDVKEANNKLQVQLGLTEKQSARMGKIAGAVYASNYGDSLGEVNTALKNVVTDIDGLGKASSKRLGGITGDVISVSKAFDQDLGGVTRAVGQLLRTGLAKDAQSALDIVTVGFQGGADKSQDFLDTLNEYGTQFRKLGLTGETATGLISQGLKAGARDGDLVADSLKEFSIRAVDGSDTTKKGFEAIGLEAGRMSERIGKGGRFASEGLDVTLDKLRRIEDPVKRSQAAVALFGTQAEDLGDALFALDPSNAVKGLGDVAGAARKANEQLGDGPKAKFEAFKRGLQQKFQAGITSAMEAIPGIITSVSNTVSSTWDRIKGTFSGGDKSASASVGRIAGNVRAFVTTVVSAVTQIKDKVAAVFSDSGIGHNLAIIGRAFLTLESVASTVILFIAKHTIPIIVGVIEGLATVIKGVVEVIAGILSGDFSKIWDGVKDIVRGAVKAIVAIVKGLAGLLWDGAKLAGETVGKGILKGLAALGHMLWDKVKSAFSFLTDGDRVAAAAKTVGDVVGKGILDGLGSLGHLLLDKAKAALSFVADNLPGPAGALGKVIKAATGDGIGKTLGSPLPSGTFGGNLMGARASMAPFASAASRFGLGVTSGKRPGSITSSGNVSYHSTGEAIDVAGNPQGMLGFFRQMKSKFGGRLAELIHTPGGAGIKNGKPYTYGGQVAADHFDHVHVAFDSGVPGVGDGIGRIARTGDGIGQAVNAARAAGFRGTDLVNAVAIAGAESGYDPTQENLKYPDHSIGLWQINQLAHKGRFGTDAQLKNPARNARAAHDLWKESGFKPWSTWPKAAAAWTDRARAAVTGSQGSKSKGKSSTPKSNAPSISDAAKNAPESPTYSGEGTANPLGGRTAIQDFLGPAKPAGTPPGWIRSSFMPGGKAGPVKGFPIGYTPPEPVDKPAAPTPDDFLTANVARARLTEGTDDDIAALTALRDLRKTEMDAALADSDPRNDEEAIDAFLQVRDALKTLTDSIDQSNEIQRQRDELNATIASNQLKILALANQGPQIVAAVVAAVSGGIGGQVGLGMQTPGYAGQVARY